LGEKYVGFGIGGGKKKKKKQIKSENRKKVSFYLFCFCCCFGLKCLICENNRLSDLCKIMWDIGNSYDLLWC